MKIGCKSNHTSFINRLLVIILGCQMFLLVPLIFYSRLAQQILNLYFRSIILGFRSDKRIEDDSKICYDCPVSVPYKRKKWIPNFTSLVVFCCVVFVVRENTQH